MVLVVMVATQDASAKMIKTCNMIAIACRLQCNQHTKQKQKLKKTQREKKAERNNKKEYSNFLLRITLFNITFGT